MNNFVIFYNCALALGMALPLAAAAQDAAQPDAPVPAVQYRSVFQDTAKGVDAESANWKEANQAVGQFLRGHVDLLKWEEQRAQPPAPKPIQPATREISSQDAMKPVAPGREKP